MSNYGVLGPDAVAKLFANYKNNSTAKTYLDTVIAFAYSSINSAPRPLVVMDIEGNLNSTDEVIVDEDLTILLSSAVRFHITKDHNSLFTAMRFLVVWAGTYKPIGNPITEEIFFKAVCGYDLIKDYMTPRQRKLVNSFFMRLFSTGKAYTLARIPALSHSNFESRGLSLMTAVAFTLGDGAMIKFCSDLFESQVDLNILAAGTVATSIPYIANAPELAAHVNDPVEKGSTFDFFHRDAVEYHVASIGGLLFAALSAKAQNLDWYGLVSTQGKTLADAVEFGKLYGDGTRTHLDFVGSFVQPFDAGRVDWFDPVHAKNLINQAAMVKPKYMGLFPITTLPLWQQVVYYMTNLV